MTPAAPVTMFVLIGIALLVLLLVGGLVALVVHRPTRVAGLTIGGIFAALLLAALTLALPLGGASAAATGGMGAALGGATGAGSMRTSLDGMGLTR